MVRNNRVKYIKSADQLALGQLGVVEFIITSPLLYELRVSSHLHDFAVVHDHDTVSILYGGQSVGDHNTRAAFLGTVQGGLYNLARECVGKANVNTPSMVYCDNGADKVLQFDA